MVMVITCTSNRNSDNVSALFHTQSLVHSGVLQFTMRSMKMGLCQIHALTHVKLFQQCVHKGQGC